MRNGLFLLLIGLLGVGCVSAKTSFRDYSDLGSTPFTYVEKNVSYTHTTVKGLCLFRSNPYLGSGPMYEGLHNAYDLGPNEAFINQRFDTVSKFYLFFCERDYTLSADIVRFSHEQARPAPQAVPQPVPQRHGSTPVVAPSRIPSGPVTVIARGELTVSCPGRKEITGRPNPTTRKATVKLSLDRTESCRVQIGEDALQVVLNPGDTRTCRQAAGGIYCRQAASDGQRSTPHPMRYAPGQ